MKKREAFTLIELLVVIAIIALLLSVLLPSLRTAKEAAKETVCQTRAKQWGMIVPMFVDENDGKFADADFDNDGNGDIGGNWWIQPLRPYYDDPQIRLCPKASVTPTAYGWTSQRKQNEAYATDNLFPELEKGVDIGGKNCLLGSFGVNGYLMDSSDGRFVSANDKRYWGRFTTIKSTSVVPMFSDCFWVDGWPKDTDVPQENPERPITWDVFGNPMQRFNLLRHRYRVNTVFADSSVRKIELKELWGLKWHREFNTGNDYASDRLEWPDWMK